MRTGRLAISRGFPAPEPRGEPARFAFPCPDGEDPPAPEPALGDTLATVNARIESLERLTRLREAGALSVDEFLVEKAALLGHRESNLSGRQGSHGPPISFIPAEPRRGRSLTMRLGWSVLPIGLVAGLALSALSQPDATSRAFDEALRLVGA